jgi:hypothetical protein
MEKLIRLISDAVALSSVQKEINMPLAVLVQNTKWSRFFRSGPILGCLLHFVFVIDTSFFILLVKILWERTLFLHNKL